MVTNNLLQSNKKFLKLTNKYIKKENEKHFKALNSGIVVTKNWDKKTLRTEGKMRRKEKNLHGNKIIVIFAPLFLVKMTIKKCLTSRHQ